MKKLVTCILLIFSLLVPMCSGALTSTAYAAETVTTPSKPTVTNVVAGIRVKWEAVDGIEKYGLWRSETGKNGKYEWLGNPGQNSYLDTEVESGNIYYYKVACVASGSGKDTKYGEKSEATGVVYVDTPDFTGRYNKAAGVTLEWQEIDGATGYAIYRKSFAGTDTWVRIGEVDSGSTLKWTDASLKNQNGAIYRYAVRALTGTDRKTLSGCYANGRTMVRLTSRILNSAEAVSESSVKCSWTTTKEATGYEVRFMTGSEVFKTFTVGNYKTGVKTFTGLESGTEYKVQVRSYKKVDGVGGFYSAWSEPVYVTTEGINPNPKEEPYEFSSGDFITTEDTRLTVGDLTVDIGANIYVPGHLEEVLGTAMSAMEQVSGIAFKGNPDTQVDYVHEIFSVVVTRDNLYDDTGSEMGAAYAVGYEACIAPGFLLLGNSNAVIHELNHVLMFRQSRWSHSQLLNEGFAEYTTYLTMLELEKNSPESAYYFDKSMQNLWDMSLSESDYAELYKYPVEHWLENHFEYGGNANYTIGFRFMAYLHDVYGDYSKWIVAFENIYPFWQNYHMSDVSTVEQQVFVLKQVYGEDVLDNFYPWLKEHESDFYEDYNSVTDRREVQKINIYPRYNAIEEKLDIKNVQYNNLYINLEPARMYLTEYKKVDASDLQLVTDTPITVNLYQADGSYAQVVTDVPISLDGISYIKLVGEGTINCLEVIGFSDVK